MYRSLSFVCSHCESPRDEFVWIDHGEGTPDQIECGFADGEQVPGDNNAEPCNCGCTTMHRVMPLTAPYMGEKIHVPLMSGGSYDTLGSVKPRALPKLAGAQDAADSLSATLAAIPESAGHQPVMDAIAKAPAPAPADYATMFSTPEYKEAKADRANTRNQNKHKKKRYAAMQRGQNVNFRTDKCAGDPKI